MHKTMVFYNTLEVQMIFLFTCLGTKYIFWCLGYDIVHGGRRKGNTLFWNYCTISVTTLALGLRPRQEGCKVMGQEGTPRSHFTCSRECKECEGMNPHTPKGTPMLGVEVPKDSRIFKARLQGTKFTALKNYLYHWKAIEV
jgi:hypothetical protein